MAEGLESRFQIKDLFQELHDSETYLLNQKVLEEDPRFKKDAIFEDVILRATANDPYYKKNEYNLSQTFHRIDFLLKPENPALYMQPKRPEINEIFISENPTGTQNFYPAFLKGPFIDIVKKPRVFEKLLLQTTFKDPTEDEILESLYQACTSEQTALLALQNDIQYRLELLEDKSTSFKNYYRNLCEWFFIGSLPENMNTPRLGPDHDVFPPFEQIPHLQEFHNYIQELNETTKNTILLLEDIQNKETEQENDEIKKRYEKQIKEQDEIAKARRDYNDMLQRQRALSMLDSYTRFKRFQEAQEYRDIYTGIATEFLKDIDFIDNNLKNVTIKYYRIDPITETEFLEKYVSWENLEKEGNISGSEGTFFEKYTQTISKKKNITEVKKAFAELLEYKNKLLAIHKFMNRRINKINDKLQKAILAIDQVKYRNAFDLNKDGNIEGNIRRFQSNLNELLIAIKLKREKYSNYEIILHNFYLTSPKSGSLSETASRAISETFEIGGFGTDRIMVRQHFKLFLLTKPYIIIEKNYFTQNGELEITNYISEKQDTMGDPEIYVFMVPKNPDSGQYGYYKLTINHIKRIGEEYTSLIIDAEQVFINP